MRLRLQQTWHDIKHRRFTPAAIGLLAGSVILLLALGGGAYALLGGFSQTSSSGDINLQKGLMSWWKLDGNAKDSSPYANDGVLNGTTAAVDRKGKASGAESFAGADTSNMIVSTDNHFPSTTLTLSTWVNSATTGNRGIISYSVSGGNDVLLYNISNLEIYVHGTNIATGVALPTEGWHHLVVTWQSSDGTVILYKDGVQAFSGTVATGTSLTNGGCFVLAQDQDARCGGFDSAQALNGSMDDVRVYNRVLSASEVSALYNEYDAQVNAASGENGLVGWWKLNGNTKDATPYGDNAAITGGVTAMTDREGAANGAYAFDGTSGYLSAGNPANLQKSYSAFTWSAWVKPTTVTKDQMFLSKQSANYLRITTSKLYNSFSIGGVQKTLTGTTTLVNNNWYLLSATYDGSAIRVYVNGVLNGTLSSLSGTLSFNTGAFDIGHYTNADPRYFVGSLGDVRLYNRALSSQELSTQYSSYNSQINLNSSPTNQSTVNLNSGLVNYWPFNGNAKDATPYQNNGTITGATLTTDRKSRANSAYSFNGTSSSYILTAGAQTVSNAVSVSAWINLANLTTNNMIVVKDPVNTEWELFVAAANLRWIGGSPFNSTMSCNGGLTAGAWHHVVGTQTGTTASLYVDGTLCQTGTQAAFTSGNGNVDIGRYPGGYYFNGSIDDVRIYNRALNAAEVAALYQNYY